MAVTYSFHNYAPVTGRYTEAEWPEAGDTDTVLILDMSIDQIYGVHGDVKLRCHNEEQPDLEAKASMSAVLDGEIWFVLKEDFHAIVVPEYKYEPKPPSPTPPAWIIPPGYLL